MTSTISNSPVKALSWRINLLWTSAGTLVYAAGNWAVLCLIAKLGTAEMVGQYALGLAVTAPVLMLAQMNLRAVLATDARGEHCFHDYWKLRLNGTLLGLAAIVMLAAMGHDMKTAAVIVAVGLAQAVEGVSDIYYGLMQRHERMDRITVSLLWKGSLSLLATGVGIWATGSVLWGVAAMFMGRLLVLLFYDATRGSRDFAAAEPKIESSFRQSAARQLSLLWLAAPLAAVMLLNSLCSNMPRYFVDHYWGTRELGIFSAAASLVSLGNTMVNAIGQAVTPRLAKLLAWEGRERFAAFSLGLMAFGAALGVCAVACAVWLGPWVLRLVFRPEYAQHNDLLVALMVAGGAGYVASMAGYAVTAARSFQPQAPVFALATLATLAACAWLIPGRGLAGAAWAVGISSAVQLAGLAFIFARVLWRGGMKQRAVLVPEANVYRQPPSTGLTAAGRLAFVFLWLFICSFPVEKTIEIPGLGNVSKVLGILALGAGFLAVLIDGRIRVLTRAHALLALFVFWTALTLRWSQDPSATVLKAVTCLQLLGMAWLIWEFCAAERNVLQLMRAYVFGTLYAAANTLLRYQLARQTYYRRYAADGFDPNDFALTLALSIPLSYSLALRAKGKNSWFYWAQLGLVAVSVLLSASRTGFLASCTAAAVIPLTFAYTRRKQKVLIVTGAVALALCLFAVVPASSWERLGTIGSEVKSGSLNDRGLIWHTGLQVYREQWFAGVGSGAYPRSVEPALGWPSTWLIVAHNTFLSVLVETGLVGFLLFVSFLALLVRTILRMQGVSRIVWAVSFMVWFVGVNTLTWEIRKPTWLLFALALAQARFAGARILRRPRPRAVPAVTEWVMEARA